MYRIKKICVLCCFTCVVLLANFSFAEQPTGDELRKKHLYDYSAEVVPKRLYTFSNITFKDGIPETLLNFYAPVYSKTDRCKADSQLYKEKLKQFEPWAVKMWDSSGKVPAGMMHAHFHDFGNFPECMEVPEIAPYEVQYCMVEFTNLVTLWSKPTGADWNDLDTLFGSIPLLKPHFHFGRCLPASCTKEDLLEHYQKVIEPYNLTTRLTKYSCTASNEETPYLFIDWAVVSYILSMCFLLTLCTVYDVTTSPEKKEGRPAKLLLAFSLYSNLKQVTKVVETNRPLSVINGLRSLSIIWIMGGHFVIFCVVQPTMNYIPQVQMQESLLAAMFATAAVAVDVFILMSGFLISYIGVQEMRKGTKFNIGLYYLNRLIRIVPIYALQLSFVMTVFYRYAGKGPSWKNNVGRLRDNCFKNWWTNILFINNYVRVREQCVPTSWYLAVDTQMYLLGPLVLFPMIKWKTFRTFGIPILILFFNGWTTMTSYSFNFRAGSLFERDLMTELSLFLYISTHGRMGVWLLGLATGYYLQMAKGKTLKLSKVVVRIGWLVAASIQGFMTISLLSFMKYGEDIDTSLHAVYNGFHRTLYGICICWILVACEMGHGGCINRFLSWWPFQIIGRISYLLYISHVGWMYAMTSAALGSHQFYVPRMFRDLFGDIVACIAISIMCSVMYELPFINVGKVLFRSSPRSNSQETKDDIPEEPNASNGHQRINLQQLNLTIHHEQNSV